MVNLSRAVLAGILLLAACGSSVANLPGDIAGNASSDVVVDTNHVSVKFITDAINASRATVIAVHQPADIKRANFFDIDAVRDSILFTVEVNNGRIWVKMDRPLQRTFEGTRCDILNAVNNVNSGATEWPVIVFRVGDNDTLEIKSPYNTHDESVSKNHLAECIFFAVDFAKIMYEDQPPLAQAYGKWSK